MLIPSGVKKIAGHRDSPPCSLSNHRVSHLPFPVTSLIPSAPHRTPSQFLKLPMRHCLPFITSSTNPIIAFVVSSPGYPKTELIVGCVFPAIGTTFAFTPASVR